MLRFKNWIRIVTFLILISAISVALQPYVSAASRATFSHREVQKSSHSACLQPPKNVDLTKLSDAQLQAYGLPTHKVIDAQPKTWSRLLSHGPRRTCGSSPDTKHSTHMLTNPDATHCGGTPGDMCPNQIWAGNQAVGSRGTYREAETEFTVPNISSSQTGSEVYIWAGIGGNNKVTSPAVLVQAGVFAEEDIGGQYNESFWEVVPGYSIQDLPLCSLSHGNTIYVYVSSNPNNNGQDYFYMQNETANCYNSYSLTNSVDFSDSATGECIVERDEYGASLANFGTLTFGYSYGCEMYDNNTQVLNGIGNFPHNYLQIYSNPSDLSTLLAGVNHIYNYGYDYSVYWKGGS
jgi:hypothetical protein